MTTPDIEPIYMAIAARVRMIRETLDMSQADLAKKLGYTRTSMVNFEAGRQRLPLHQLQEIAKALNTTPRNLLKGIWV